MDSQHLLAPIKVQALVIDDIVFQKRGVVEHQGSYYANDGRWSPQLFDYDELAMSLLPPGPKPFYGASRVTRAILQSNSSSMTTQRPCCKKKIVAFIYIGCCPRVCVTLTRPAYSISLLSRITG